MANQSQSCKTFRGPKIRVGNLGNQPINIREGSIVRLPTEPAKDDETKIPIGPRDLPEYVPEWATIFLSDCSIRLRVMFSAETSTAADKDHLDFGLRHGVDIVAVSFVRKASDINEVRAFAMDRAKVGRGLLFDIQNREGRGPIESRGDRRGVGRPHGRERWILE